jgi:hypothetical protein
MANGRNVHNSAVGIPGRKINLARPRRRWHRNMQINLEAVGGGLDIGFVCLRTGKISGLLWIRK